jgi:hypothetical protein
LRRADEVDVAGADVVAREHFVDHSQLLRAQVGRVTAIRAFAATSSMRTRTER